MATLKIYGDIGESMPDIFGLGDTNTISAKDVSTFLDANADATEIVVKINSRGGDVQEGWAIYDLLTTSGKTIKTIGEGKVYSIATIIFLAGSERSMMQNADGLIHNPFIPEYTLSGAYESTDLAKMAEQLADEESKILDFYAMKTGTDKAKLADYMSKETKLSADDMVTLGFATKVIEPVKAYAIFKHLKTKNQMANESEKIKIMERFDALMLGDFAKAFSRLPAESKNMELTDTTGNKLTVEKETGEPAVGDVASPDGTYVMDNGDTIVVTNGVIESITPAEVEVTTNDTEKDAKIAELTAELDALKTKNAATETALVDLKAAETEMISLVTELRGLKNSWKPAARTTGDGGTNKVDGIDMNRVMEIIKNQK